MHLRQFAALDHQSIRKLDDTTRRLFTASLRVWLLISLTFLATSAIAADDGFEEDEDKQTFHVQPDDEFVIPEGNIRQGGGRHVLLKGSSSELVVGRLYVEGDKRYLVTMPNGSLKSVSKDEVKETYRPFKAETAEEMQEGLLAGDFQGFKAKRTKRYLYLYDCSDDYFKAANMILETMYPKMVNFCEKLDLDVHDPEFPMVVIMFGDRESFDEFKRVPRGVAAYYSLISNHIVMYEDPELTQYAPQLALKSSVSTIAHEGVHQILGNIGVQQRFAKWPIWIQEGLPEYCSPTETGKRVRWRGLGRMNNLRMHSLVRYRKYVKENKSKKHWFDIKEVVEAKGLTSLGYAHAWGTVYGMAKSRKTKDQFAEMMRELNKYGPLEGPEKPEELWVRHFGDNYKENAQHIVKELTKAYKKDYRDPIENQTYFVAILETRSSYYSYVSPSIAAIRQWAQEIDEAGIRSKMRVESFPSKSKAEAAKRQFLRRRL